MKMHLTLLTDLYELTMAAAYYRHEMFAPATFSLFIRNYPPGRGYFVNAGLEDVLDFLENFHFNDDDLEYLDSLEMFTQDFLVYLRSLRFTGDVRAMPEGRLFFKDEPILEVTGPIIEAQLAESFIINAINLPVCIATKASRCYHAAHGRNLVDFSLRRTQGTDAGLKAARASYIGGFNGTSNVLAGKHYDIPVSGTMAHSFITSFEHEIDAFRAFSRTFPDNTVLLLDTYDTASGAKKAVQIAREMAEQGKSLKGVRLDSGDMAQLSREVRKIFQEADLTNVSIFASGSFDEYKISELLNRNAEIDAFGVGTKMGVSSDAPYTDIAYKLVQYNGRPVLKLSTGKKTLVSEKQVFRVIERERLRGDMITLREEEGEGEPLLAPVMIKGKRQRSSETPDRIRERFIKEFSLLDSDFKDLKKPALFPVTVGPRLEAFQKEVTAKMIDQEL